MKVLDLGAAPGGWSQYAAQQVLSPSEAPLVVALDLKSIPSIPGVLTFQGDIRDREVTDKVLDALQGPADILLSDMSSNHTGDGNVDSTETIDLGVQAMHLAHKTLKPGACAIMKVFSGISEPDHFVLPS